MTSASNPSEIEEDEWDGYVFPHPNSRPLRIGVLLNGLEEANVDALKYLILHSNRLQNSFQFEFYTLPNEDALLSLLRSKDLVDRTTVKSQIPSFYGRCMTHLTREVRDYGLQEPPPTYFIIVSLARFMDEFYSTRKGNVSVLALGNWERQMAPPTIFEFLFTLVMREAVAAISPSLRGSVHLGTKGCLLDFTANLPEARYKVLGAFVCAHCRSCLDQDRLSHLKQLIPSLLDKKWLGISSEAGTPASIIAKLGHDLFATKGLQATWLEKSLSTLREEGVKQIITVIGVVLAAGLIAYFGLKKP